MKKKVLASPPSSPRKVDPALVPKARVLIGKIRAKLKQLNAESSAKKSGPPKKTAKPAPTGKKRKAAVR